MQKYIRMLAIAMLVQIALAAITISGSSHLPTASQGDRLLSFDPVQVDGITIHSGDGAEVRLHKKGRWQLADGFPADSQRITRLLDRLHAMRHGLAVATAPTAQARFSVAAKKFERRLTLLHGKQPLAVLYLGRGAGARRSHVRVDEQTAIYSVKLGSYDLPVDDTAWQDKAVLQVSGITAIEAGGVRVEKRKDAQAGSSPLWRSDKTPKGKQPDDKAIGHAASLLEALRFTQSLGTRAPAGYDFTDPALGFSIDWRRGHRKYRFARHAKNDRYVLKVSDRPEYFEIAGHVFDGLKVAMTPEKWFSDIKSTHAEGQGSKPQQERTSGSSH